MIRVFLIFMFGVLVMGCDGSGIVSLGGGYYLSKSDRDHVYIYKESGRENAADMIVIDQQVVDVEVVDGYVFVLRKIAESFDCYDEKNVPTIITKYSDVNEYWLIDLHKGSAVGPLGKAGFSELQRDLGLPPVNLTATSDFQPNIGAFEKWSKSCKRLE